MLNRWRGHGLDSVDAVVVVASIFFGSVALSVVAVLWYVVAVLP